jgi:hypothetical protein
VIATERDRTSFERYKLLKFWSQSFLAGVPRVVVGFRDDEGIGTYPSSSPPSPSLSSTHHPPCVVSRLVVRHTTAVRTVQHLNTLDMPRFVEGKRGMWVRTFLQFLSSALARPALDVTSLAACACVPAGLRCLHELLRPVPHLGRPVSDSPLMRARVRAVC